MILLAAASSTSNAHDGQAGRAVERDDGIVHAREGAEPLQAGADAVDPPRVVDRAGDDARLAGDDVAPRDGVPAHDEVTEPEERSLVHDERECDAAARRCDTAGTHRGQRPSRRGVHVEQRGRASGDGVPGEDVPRAQPAVRERRPGVRGGGPDEHERVERRPRPLVERDAEAHVAAVLAPCNVHGRQGPPETREQREERVGARGQRVRIERRRRVGHEDGPHVSRREAVGAFHIHVDDARGRRRPRRRGRPATDGEDHRRA